MPLLINLLATGLPFINSLCMADSKELLNGCMKEICSHLPPPPMCARVGFCLHQCPCTTCMQFSQRCCNPRQDSHLIVSYHVDAGYRTWVFRRAASLLTTYPWLQPHSQMNIFTIAIFLGPFQESQ